MKSPGRVLPLKNFLTKFQRPCILASLSYSYLLDPTLNFPSSQASFSPAAHSHYNPAVSALLALFVFTSHTPSLYHSALLLLPSRPGPVCQPCSFCYLLCLLWTLRDPLAGLALVSTIKKRKERKNLLLKHSMEQSRHQLVQ